MVKIRGSRRKYRKRLIRRSTTQLAKRARYTPSRAPVYRSISAQSGFPKMLKMKHRYAAVPIQINSTTGAMATYTFSANSMFDPDVSGGGHQPLYFDQMSLIYNNYIVIGSKISIRLQCTEDPIGPSVGCLWIDDDTGTTATNLSFVTEQDSKNKLRNFGGPNSNPNTVWNKKWSAKKHFGGSILSNVDLMGSPTASPNNEVYYKFSYNTLDTTSATVFVTYIVEYIAVWRDKKEVAQS